MNKIIIFIALFFSCAFAANAQQTKIITSPVYDNINYEQRMKRSINNPMNNQSQAVEVEEQYNLQNTDRAKFSGSTIDLSYLNKCQPYFIGISPNQTYIKKRSFRFKQFPQNN